MKDAAKICCMWWLWCSQSWGSICSPSLRIRDTFVPLCSLPGLWAIKKNLQQHLKAFYICNRHYTSKKKRIMLIKERRQGLMYEVKETNTTVIACQDSVDQINIAASSWFIVISFLKTSQCCKNIQMWWIPNPSDHQKQTTGTQTVNISEQVCWQANWQQQQR